MPREYPLYGDMYMNFVPKKNEVGSFVVADKKVELNEDFEVKEVEDQPTVPEYLKDNKKRYERLSNPEEFENELKQNIEQAEADFEFTQAGFNIRSQVGLELGKLGGKKVTRKMIEKATVLLGETGEVLEKIKNLDLKSLSIKAAEGIKNFIKDNWLSLTPILITPLAAVTGGDVQTAVKASVELTAGMYSLDKVLDSIMDNAEEILPPQYLVPLIAGTTNLAEAGASQMSALVGDPLEDVAATPLGSNPTNLYLTGFAMMNALKMRAINEGIIQQDEKLGFKAMKQTLKKMDWPEIKKQMGFSGVMALDALAFQTLVRPQMKKGNFLPLAGWTAINVPFLVQYFKKTTFSREAKMGFVLDKFDKEKIKEIKEKIMKGGGDNNMMEGLLYKIESYTEADKEGEKKIKKKELNSDLVAMREQLVNDEGLQKIIESFVNEADSKDLENLFKVAKIKFETGKKIDKKKAIKVITGVIAVGGLSIILDRGVTDIADALPYLSKGAAGFFIMSFLSSIGEFLTTKKFFQKGQDLEATKNITDSNAINIGLAQGAMATSAARSMMI